MGSSRFFIIFALCIIGIAAGGQAIFSKIPIDQVLRNLKTEIPITHAATAGSEDSTIQLEREGGVWVTDVEINNLHQARLIVDTGASLTLISEDLAFDAGIQADVNSPRARIQGVSGSAEAKMGIVQKIQVGHAERGNVRVFIYTMPKSSGVDGLLGLSFFDGFVVQLDHAQGLLHLTPKS